MMVVYELHTFRDGIWKIDSVFDDRDLAVLEARRIERSRHYRGVRVAEESFDHATDRPVKRTIYHSTKGDPTPRSKSAAASSRPRGAQPAAKQRSSRLGHRVWLATLTVSGLLVVALGALYAMSYLGR